MTLIKKKYIREKGLLLSKGLIKGVFIPSKTDSVFYWTGKFDGTDLVNEVGTNIPLVSGTGLDAIYDFSGLSSSSCGIYLVTNTKIQIRIKSDKTGNVSMSVFSACLRR